MGGQSAQQTSLPCAAKDVTVVHMAGLRNSRYYASMEGTYFVVHRTKTYP